MDEENYILNWNDVVMEICFDYEPKYKPSITDNYVCVYKTTFYSNGEYERKGNIGKYDPALFPQIIRLIHVMMGETFLPKETVNMDLS